MLGCLLYSGCSFTCSGLTNVVFEGFIVGVTNVGFKGFYEVDVNQCWGLKVFSVEVTNVVLKGLSRRGHQCGV